MQGRDQLQPGDLVMFRGTGWIARTIMRWTNSPYSHVAMVAAVTPKSVVIIEADRFTQVRVRTIRPDEDVTPYRAHGSYDPAAAVRFAEVFMGMEYDYAQLLGWAIRRLSKRPATRNLFDTRSRLICSELVDLALWGAGAPRADLPKLGDLTPGDLFEAYDLRPVM